MLEMLQIIGCPRLVSLKLLIDLHIDNKMSLSGFYLSSRQDLWVQFQNNFVYRLFLL